MTQARRELVDPTETPFYHCISRCVRRAFLCGRDEYTGKDFSYRKQWVVDRLIFLAGIFAIDICAYAVMSNHLHLVIRLACDRAREWSTEEVVDRYGTLFPSAKAEWLELSDSAQKAARVELWRERLCSISWMMRALNEWIARRANREDDCRGRFWEGRFTSQPLLDETGVLACMAYTDLNPIRAGAVSSLDGGGFTSIEERIRAVLADEPLEHLVPFRDIEAKDEDGAEDEAHVESLPFRMADYVAVLEWTAKHREGDQGSAPSLFGELGVSPSGWMELMTERGLGTTVALGRLDRMTEYAEKRQKKRVHGRRYGALLAA